jgi:hypothetical protein
MVRVPKSSRKCRQAAAAVELAILLPLVLAPLMVITVDWARVFYYGVTLENCARQGAMYGSGAAAGSSITTAATNEWFDPSNGAFASNFTVTSANGTDGNGDPTIAVTASCQVKLVCSIPGIGQAFNVSRTVTMRIAQ